MLKITNGSGSVEVRDFYGSPALLQALDGSAGLLDAFNPAHGSSGSAAEVAAQAREADSRGDYRPTDGVDARARAMRAIALRSGQPAFRSELIRAYGGRCAFTGCNAEAALEAAHIQPYRGDATHHVQNGLLLRADLHTLFDRGLVAVDARTWKVVIAPELRSTTYAELAGRDLRLPADERDRPSEAAVDRHRRGCGL